VKSEKLPKGWEEKQLGEIMQFEYGKALKAEERKTGIIQQQIKIHQKGRANLISHFHYYDTFPKRRHKIQVKK